jgi:anti-sigma regulatory factor (Ser/Thr protein kinase)
MAIVDVSFTALPAHVRTARLVALAVARRIGVPDEALDEVRLAVSEACSRAVGVHAARAPEAPVLMRLSDDRDCFTVEVTDVGPLEDDAVDAVQGAFDDVKSADDLIDDDASDSMPPSFGLAVIGGLVEEVVVTSDDAGTHVKMAWPTTLFIPAQSD